MSIFQPYPHRRRIYVRTAYVLLRTHQISRRTFARLIKDVMGSYR